MPGVEAHVYFLVEGQRSEMTVAAPHVIDGRRQGQILIIRTLDRTQKCTEVRKVSQL